VAETESRKEGLAILNLERQSFRCLCPRIKRVRRHARRTETVLAPLFPGYVFVNFDVDTDPWHSINGTLGIKRLIGFDQAVPQAMPEGAMASLLEKYRDDETSSPGAEFQAGDSVLIISGPFAEQYAKVESLDDRGRVRLLFDILGGAVRLSLAAHSVAPADR
jgi:transcriptional antiterminator RfaH